MEFFKFKKDIAFMKHASLLNVLSIFVFIGSIIFISYKGLHFSIEFTGGTVIEVSYENEAPIENNGNEKANEANKHVEPDRYVKL